MRKKNILILGASNLTFSIRKVLRYLTGYALGAKDYISIILAHGPGRSYGVEEGYSLIKFPGIKNSGAVEFAVGLSRWSIKPSLLRSDNSENCALITDIGNDIMYGKKSQEILSWVDDIVTKLTGAGFRVGITPLPAESVKDVSRWKFLMIRAIFFPTRNISRDEVVKQVNEVQKGLEEIAKKRNAVLLETQKYWYSQIDHFHLKRKYQSLAFSSWLNALMTKTEKEVGRTRVPLKALFPGTGRFKVGPFESRRRAAPSIHPHPQVSIYRF